MSKGKKDYMSDEEDYDHGSGSHKPSGVEPVRKFPGTTVNSMKLQHRKAVVKAEAVPEWTEEDMDLLFKAYEDNHKVFYLKVASATVRDWLGYEKEIVELGKEVMKGHRA
ncbi:hypothetical protein YB2330_003903 [Saitoella coloradoensis]